MPCTDPGRYQCLLPSLCPGELSHKDQTHLLNWRKQILFVTILSDINIHTDAFLAIFPKLRSPYNSYWPSPSLLRWQTAISFALARRSSLLRWLDAISALWRTKWYRGSRPCTPNLYDQQCPQKVPRLYCPHLNVRCPLFNTCSSSIRTSAPP